MIPENKVPALYFETIPNSDEAASRRITECCLNGLEGMYRLSFKDIGQFQRALAETGLVGKIDGCEKPWKKTLCAVHYQVTAIGKDYAIWWILLSQPMSENDDAGLLRVENVYCKEEGVKNDDAQK